MPWADKLGLRLGMWGGLVGGESKSTARQKVGCFSCHSVTRVNCTSRCATPRRAGRGDRPPPYRGYPPSPDRPPAPRAEPVHEQIPKKSLLGARAGT